MSTQALNTRKQRVFDSVFGAQSISLPTPHATPATGFTAPGQTWGGPLPGNLDEKLRNSLSEARGLLQPSRGLFLDADDHVEDQVRWDRAWHLVTHTLSLPNFKGDGMEREILKPEPEQLDEKFYGALERVISPGTCLPLARQTEDVVVWFTSQVRHNFLHEVLPIVLRLRKQYVQESLLGRSIKALEMANRQYFHGLWFIAQGIENAAPGESKTVTEKFRRDLNAVITNSVMEPLGDALMCVLRRQVSKVLGLPPKKELESSTILPEGPKTEKARHEMLGLVEALQNVGLAGERFQVTFAEIMNDSMTEYVHRGCEGVWSPNDHEKNRSSAEGRDGSILPRTAHHASPSRCVTELCEWIEDRYAKLAVQVFSVLKIKGSISWTDKEKYKEMSIGRLAELRINELFDIVVNWPHSSGALDDLRTAITTPQRRLHLTEVFAKTLQDRLLHPGASTLQILQTYISMIWSFHALDHSKVLLDRVAYPLQLYLCSREDTVRIIITGLLSDTEDGDGNPVKNTGDKLVELAQLLNKGPEEFGQRPNDEELDWHDMDWVPDPVDAGPGYKRSKSADIIGTLIGVLGAQEVFIKEFQNIIGENLLRQDGDFDKEIKVLELLKLRFGEPPLQACEVMLKDIQDSTRVNTIIRHKQSLGTIDDVATSPPKPAFLRMFNQAQAHLNPPTSNSIPDKSTENESLSTSLHAKILSRLFWPSLNDERYKVPPSIASLQRKYEQGFEELKSARKLTWLPALGQATVELELRDRTVVEEVHTWQAAVIYAFDDEGSEEPISRTVDQLVEQLEMDEELVSSALRFWTHKLVLHESAQGTYIVLETLNTADRERSNAQTSSSAPHSGNGSEDSGMGGRKGKGKGEGGMDKDSDKMGIYWSFVQGMLTNSSKEMQVGQIGMMLKMLIVEGFPFSNEELGEWLGGKAQEGLLEVNGGKYRLKR